MRHPSESELALCGGGDLGRWQSWRIRQHLAGCVACAEQAARYRSDRGAIAQSALELPEGLDWNGLEAEMRANIHLGLAAGECVSQPVRAEKQLSWKAAFVLASMTAMILTGWWLHIPQPPVGPGGPLAARHQKEVVLETTRFAIERTENGSTFALAHPPDNRTVLTANTDGALRARFVDDDSGQVTINNVYAQ